MRLAPLLLLCACARNAAGAADFEALLGRIADGWNRNDARQAAECFAPDAVYEEPPGKQLYRGRAALFDFFGGNEASPPEPALPRIVIVRLRNGLVDRWREYQVQSDMKWEDFVTATRF